MPEEKDPEMDKPKRLTFGEQAVGIGFNPSKDADVQEVKELCAQLIDKVETLKSNRKEQSYLSNTIDGEAVRRVIDAQMWVVKAVTLDK